MIDAADIGIDAADAAYILKILPIMIRNTVGSKPWGDIPSPEEVWERIITTERPRVLSLARSIVKNADDAEDVTQEVFVVASKAFERFQGNCTFRTWLYTITVRCARRFLVRKRKDQKRLEQWANEQQERKELLDRPLESLILENEEIREGLVAIAQLPEKYAVILYLHYVCDLSCPMIAERLQMQLDTVTTRLRRGRRLLRNEIQALPSILARRRRKDVQQERYRKFEAFIRDRLPPDCWAAAPKIESWANEITLTSRNWFLMRHLMPETGEYVYTYSFDSPWDSKVWYVM